MASTISDVSGDGVLTNLIQLNISLPDTNGGNIVVAGQVKAVAGLLQAVAGAVAFPVAPASGSIYFIVEVNLVNGVVALLQSTVSTPVPDANNIMVLSDILTATTTDLAQNPNFVTPDTY